ncbi:uncharacterized protein [Drosophila suzukii]|uniref:C-type lectin domain-containing protein n=1 Tax=Drosophila suzukii TaxID=28584 RepID=A0ABM4TSG0_DROSZ
MPRMKKQQQQLTKGSRGGKSVISQIQNKLNTIEGNQNNMLNRLSDKETEKQIRLDAQLLQRELDLLNKPSKKIITQEDFEAALQRKTEEIQSKMNSDLLALEKRFESKMQILQARLEDQGIQDRSKNLPDKFSENSSKILNEEYVLIGGKYYFIERNIKLDHNAAAKKCCQRGGYLVTIQTEEELNSLQGKLKFNEEYWAEDGSPDGAMLQEAGKQQHHHQQQQQQQEQQQHRPETG